MHRLLQRQIHRHFGSLAVPESFQAFIDSVDRAYQDFDTDRAMIERSMEISSQELLQANAELRAVLAAFPDLFIWVDARGEIVNTKAGDQRDLYLSAGSLVGKYLHDVPTPGIGNLFAEALAETRSSGRSTMVEYELPLDAGTSVYEARVFPLVNGQALVIIRNITDTRRVELAESANKAKSEFLANMSHELRTPLHGILSFARFGVTRIDSSEKSKLLEYFNYIQMGGETLLSLLNDLLDVAKLEAGKSRFELAPTDLGALLEREIDQFRSRLSEEDLTIRYDPPEQRLSVMADASKIAQVVRNLVSNAVKFSPGGGAIEIRTTCSEHAVQVAISDQGAGIPEDELEQVFDKFVQSTRTNTGAGGTGLGLAICREIIQAHGGTIWAERSPTGGARLVFELVLPEAAARASDAAPVVQHRGAS